MSPLWFSYCCSPETALGISFHQWLLNTGKNIRATSNSVKTCWTDFLLGPIIYVTFYDTYIISRSTPKRWKMLPPSQRGLFGIIPSSLWWELQDTIFCCLPYRRYPRIFWDICFKTFTFSHPLNFLGKMFAELFFFKKTALNCINHFYCFFWSLFYLF